MAGLTFDTIVNDSAIWSHLQQRVLNDTLVRELGDDHRFDVDLDRSLLVFSSGQATREARLHMLATVAPGPQSLLWAWANPQFGEHPVAAAAREVKAFGEHHGVRELARDEVPLDAPHDPDELEAGVTDMAHRAAMASAQITGLRPYYTADAGGGTRVVMLLEGLALPRPAVVDVPAAIAGATEAGHITSLPRAVHHLGLASGWDTRWADDGQVCELTDTRGGRSVDIRFEGNRLDSISLRG